MKLKIVMIIIGILLVSIVSGVLIYNKVIDKESLLNLEVEQKELKGILSASSTALIPNGCDHAGTGDCTLSNINSYDANSETLDKNEIWIIMYDTVSCSSINSAEVCLDIWAQDVPSGETVTFECSVDNSTWDKCGTNTFVPAASKTTYCYTVTSGVTCSNLADFTSKLTSNDDGGPDDFYLDFTNVSIDYEESAEPDNCWIDITGGIYVPEGCTYYIEGGSEIYIT